MPFVLFGFSKITQDRSFVIMAGMVSCVLGVYIFINQFPGIESTFLTEGLGVILLGFGFYLMAGTGIEMIKEGFG